jgi:hypothetical protein
MLDRDSPAASRNHAATTILELGFGKSPVADKGDVKPGSENPTDEIQDAREALIAAVESTIGQQLIECPACYWLMPEESAACQHCGLRAEDVTDEMIRDTQNAKANDGSNNTPVKWRRRINLRTFSQMLANFEKEAGTGTAEEGEV